VWSLDILRVEHLSFVGNFPIGCSPLLLSLLLISIGSKQDQEKAQEADLDLRLFSEENSRFSEF